MVEETTARTEYHNSESLINNGIERKMTCNEITSQVRQHISDELIPKNSYHTDIRKERHLKI